MRKKWTFQWKKIMPYLLVTLANLVIFIFLLAFGSPHYATNDDVTLNNIAVGNYGMHNRPYLVFGNICYGYLLTALYTVADGINWYGIFPIIVSMVCFLSVAYLFVYRASKPVGMVLPFLFVLLFGKYILIEVQFTHFAAFFSAIGLFLMYASLFKKGAVNRGCGIIGTIIALIGFWIRRDAFLSVAAILGVCCLIKIIRYKFWRLEIAEIIRQARVFVVLVVLIIASSLINHIAYQSDEEWRYWSEYNTYRANLLDYPLPDYETYANDYQEIGIDQLDFEMLCTWNYADLNKFSMETLRELCELQQRVKKDTFVVKEVFKQFVRDISNCFLEHIAFPIVVIICVVYMLWDKKNAWMSLPICVLGAELLYLSYSGRFIFRSYLGLWVAVALVVFLALEDNTRFVGLFNMRQTVAIMLGISAFHLPWAFSIWHDHYKTEETLFVENADYVWRDELSKDTESLYLAETLFGGMPETLNPLKRISRYYHNFYSLGGWTCPAPLEQYLLERYEIQEEGVMKGLLNDKKNVYYIERADETSRYRLIEYLRKEYDERVNVERVNVLENICIYRFYVDSMDLLEEAVSVSDINYDLQIIDSGETLDILGFCYYNSIEPYKQDVWIKVSYKENDREDQYVRCEKAVKDWIAEITGDFHLAASGIQCTLEKELLEEADSIELVIEYEEIVVSTEVSSVFNMQNVR